MMARLLTPLVLIVTLMLMTVVTMVVSADATYGSARYGRETVKSLSVYGTLALDGTEVTEKVQVNGSFKGKGARIRELEVNGNVKMEDSVVIKNVVVNGAVELLNSQIDGALTASSDNIILNHSTTSNISIKEVGENHTAPTIRLINGSKAGLTHEEIIFH